MSFDDVEVALDSAEVKTLLLQITQVLAPPGKSAQGGEGEMKTFMRHLRSANDPGIQALLREISSDTLIMALKGSDEAIKEKIFNNMSRRAGEMLKDDLEARSPVKLSEVETAQKEILAVARRMAETGEISLGGKGGDEYV